MALEHDITADTMVVKTHIVENFEGLDVRVVALEDATIPLVTVTNNLAMTQANQRVVMDAATGKTITLPDAAQSINRRFVLMNAGAGTLTVQCAGSDEIIGSPDVTSVNVLTGETLEVLGIQRADASYAFIRS